MSVNDKHLYEQAKKSWLVSNGLNCRANEHWVVGETTRSWLVGAFARPVTYLKRDYRIVSKDEAEKINWVYDNRENVSRCLSDYTNKDITYENLKKIAEIVGYKGGQP